MSEEMDSNTKQLINIRLLDEGTTVSRPTEALLSRQEELRVLPTSDYDPENEKWEFPPRRPGQKKSNGRLYWYGAPGIVAESDLSGNLTAEYVFFDGERVARRDYPSGAVHFYFSDLLGSVSVVASATGAIEDESDYSPWGEERPLEQSLTDQHFKFNGMERDTETGFQDFGARFYSPSSSRWLTPDWSFSPEAVPYAYLVNPQSLNLYGYALSNPTTLPDLDGHLTPLGSCCGGGQQPSDTCTPDMPDCERYSKVDGVLTKNSIAERIVAHGQGAECPAGFPRCGITGDHLMGLRPRDSEESNSGTIIVFAGWQDLGPLWRYIPDQPVGMDIWHCAGCKNTWQQSSKTADRLAIGSAVAPFAAAGVGEAAVVGPILISNAYAYLRYVLPAAPIAIRALRNMRAPGEGSIS